MSCMKFSNLRSMYRTHSTSPLHIVSYCYFSVFRLRSWSYRQTGGRLSVSATRNESSVDVTFESELPRPAPRDGLRPRPRWPPRRSPRGDVAVGGEKMVKRRWWSHFEFLWKGPRGQRQTSEIQTPTRRYVSDRCRIRVRYLSLVPFFSVSKRVTTCHDTARLVIIPILFVTPWRPKLFIPSASIHDHPFWTLSPLSTSPRSWDAEVPCGVNALLNLYPCSQHVKNAKLVLNSCEKLDFHRRTGTSLTLESMRLNCLRKRLGIQGIQVSKSKSSQSSQ